MKKEGIEITIKAWKLGAIVVGTTIGAILARKVAEILAEKRARNHTRETLLKLLGKK